MTPNQRPIGGHSYATRRQPAVQEPLLCNGLFTPSALAGRHDRWKRLDCILLRLGPYQRKIDDKGAAKDCALASAVADPPLQRGGSRYSRTKRLLMGSTQRTRVGTSLLRSPFLRIRTLRTRGPGFARNGCNALCTSLCLVVKRGLASLHALTARKSGTSRWPQLAVLVAGRGLSRPTRQSLQYRFAVRAARYGLWSSVGLCVMVLTGQPVFGPRVCRYGRSVRFRWQVYVNAGRWFCVVFHVGVCLYAGKVRGKCEPFFIRCDERADTYVHGKHDSRTVYKLKRGLQLKRSECMPATKLCQRVWNV